MSSQWDIIIPPFSQDIREAPLLAGFKLPTYEGKTNPQKHLDYFNDLTELHRVSDLAKYRYFVVTLTKCAKKGFRSLEPRLYSPWS